MPLQRPPLPNRNPLRRSAGVGGPPPASPTRLPPSNLSGPSAATSPSPPSEGLEGSSANSLDQGLKVVMQHLYSNPEVAYVIGSIKKGLAGIDVAALSQEEKDKLLQEITDALERSPSVLAALKEFRGS